MEYKQAIILLLCAYFISGQVSTRAKQCGTPDNQFGTCVPITQCEGIMKFIKGRKVLTKQEKSALRSHNCGISSKEQKICCPWSDFNLDWAYNNCRTPDDEMGKCKPLDACEPMLNYLNSRSNINQMAKMTLKKYVCRGGTLKRPNVCCPNKPLMYIDVRPEKPVDHSKHKNAHLLPTSCGQQASEDKIYNGKATRIYEFPWAVALKIKRGSSFAYECGGSLITNRYVLTAAHCIPHNEKQIVGLRLGEHDFTKDKDCSIGPDGSEYCAPPHEDFDVTPSDVTVHSHYNTVSHKNDIALIRLRRPVNITAAIAPVCLPLKITEKWSKEIRKFIVIGWGLLKTGEESNVLMKAEVPFQCITKCVNITSFNGQLCAGGVNQTDPCSGDSGGPLTADRVDDGILKSIQYGIVSVGPEVCGKEDYPTIYTNVAAYMDWILDHLEP